MQFVLINLGISHLDGRCSPGFQSSSGVFLSLSLRPLHFDRMDVTPLLRRRLSWFTEVYNYYAFEFVISALFCWLSITCLLASYSSFAYSIFSALRQTLQLTYKTLCSHLSTITSRSVSALYAASLHAYQPSFAIDHKSRFAINRTKQFWPSPFFVLFVLTKNQTFSLEKRHPS